MAEFAVRVVKIAQPVEHHPNADRLSLIRVGGYICISAKLEDGSHRYNEGDLIVYVPEGAVVPEYLLKQGFWSEKENKGILAGPDGNRVKALRLRGIFSQGILFPVQMHEDSPQSDELNGTIYATVRVPNDARDEHGEFLFEDGWEDVGVEPGEDVAALLGVVKYQPPIPEELLGDVIDLFGTTYKFDFDSIQTVTDLFDLGEDVVATEKLNGTNCQIGYAPDLNNPELFFDGNLYVSQKGLATQGLSLNNSEDNQAKNIYVKMLHRLLADGFGERIKALSDELGQTVRVFGEIYGAGVQRGYRYGKEDQAFAVFDVQIGDDFVPFDQMKAIADRLKLNIVPVLYEGPFDLDAIQVHRDGKDTISGSNLREGVVIKARDSGRHQFHGRKIGKWVSPDYAVKATGEEFN